MNRSFEIRCPIYGFIQLEEWERDIVSVPAFQRLRRIRQLAWTDYVYPGAMHTRFEHSLGVMHMATQLYDAVAQRSWFDLQEKFGFNKAGRERYRQLVRFAALLHDVGHGPFSHAVEELAPIVPGGTRKYRHEEYSTAIIRNHFKDVIENHPANNNYGFRVEEVTGLIEGGVNAGRAALWQDLISGQLDADRMDYLLRDSYHAGVAYGHYDWRRIVAAIKIVSDPESGSPKLGIAEDGRHAAEAMIIARYMMFNQVYFHKTRVILDFHLQKAFETMLPGKTLPTPSTPEGVDQYLAWDDWRVLGKLSNGEGDEHGSRLRERDFYRMVWATPEFPDDSDDRKLAKVEEKLADLHPIRREASKSWYKVGSSDLPISANPGGKSQPLSMRSTIGQHMEPTRLVRLYVSSHDRGAAERRINQLFQEMRDD
jgi:HD superfamily phosphohydrolase